MTTTGGTVNSRRSADRYWRDRVTGYPAFAAHTVLHPGPAAGVIDDQHREQFADRYGQLCGVVRRDHDGGPGARIDVPRGHPPGSVIGSDEDEGRPGSVMAANLDALAGGYLDGPPAG